MVNLSQMKRLIPLAAALVACLSMFGQTSLPVNDYMERGTVSHNPVFTPVVGIGGSSLLESDGDGNTGTSGGFAIKAGVDVEFPINASWSFQTGLSFMSLMGHSNGIVSPEAAVGYGVQTFEESIHQNFLHLPVMAGLRLHLSGSMHFLVRFGGFLGCGVGGNTKITRGKSMDESYGTFSGNGFNRFDAGPEWAVTLEYRRFNIGYNGFVGLVNRSSYFKANNFVNFFTLGYTL